MHLTEKKVSNQGSRATVTGTFKTYFFIVKNVEFLMIHNVTIKSTESWAGYNASSLTAVQFDLPPLSSLFSPVDYTSHLPLGSNVLYNFPIKMTILSTHFWICLENNSMGERGA